KEFAKLALLLLEAAQRLGAVLVERAVAARAPRAALAEAVHLGAHAVHLLLHAVLPAVVAAAAPATHLPAPDRDAGDDQAQRPPEDEPEDHRDDPHRVPVPGRRRRAPGRPGPVAALLLGPILIVCRVAHGALRGVNVNYIYIDKPRPAGCQWGPEKLTFGFRARPPWTDLGAHPASSNPSPRK